jgi:predicted nicotinamide N-methyase
MAKMVSPGVFTQEKDQGFLPQALGEIGGAIIGRSPKGPAFKPTIVNNFTEFKKWFGNVNSEYLCSYAAKDYLENAGNMTFVRVLGGGAFTYNNVGEITSGSELLAVIRPTYGSDASINMKVTGSTLTLDDFDLYVSQSGGETTFSNVSLRNTDTNYLGNIIGTNPKNTTYDVYLDHVYSAEVSKSLAGIDGNGTLTESSITSSTSAAITTNGFSNASSPTIISQTFGTTNHELFDIQTLADGTAANQEIKISISDIKPADDIANSDYGKFTLIVREYNDTDINPVILETFSNLDLNENSPDYIARRIGDQYTVTDSEGKITVYGDYENISEYIRIDMKNLNTIPKEAVPFGFKNLKKYNSNTPDPVYQLSQSYNSEYDDKVYFGEDFTAANVDNYHTFLPTNAANASTDFLLSNCIEYVNNTYSGSLVLANTDSTKLKFSFGFQNGFDGYDPRLAVVSQSTFTTATTSGSVEYRKAIDTVGNPEEFDVNLMVTPECNHRQHSAVTSYLMDKCRDRGDALAVIDPGPKEDSINTVIKTIQPIDNSYAATYYPYVKIKDEENNKNV